MRLPNKVKANRETCKVWKMCMHHTRSIIYAEPTRSDNTRRKANIYASKNGMTNVFHNREFSGGYSSGDELQDET